MRDPNCLFCKGDGEIAYDGPEGVSTTDCDCSGEPMRRDRAVQILDLRASGHVQRCHTSQHHGLYLISSHVGQMVVLALALHPDPSVRLLRAVVFHDHPELKTGDVHGRTKRDVPALKALLDDIERRYFEDYPLAQSGDLTEDEARWLAALDSLELYLWCRDQELLGNRHAEIMADRVFGWLSSDRTPYEVMSFVVAERDLTWKERCFE